MGDAESFHTARALARREDPRRGIERYGRRRARFAMPGGSAPTT